MNIGKMLIELEKRIVALELAAGVKSISTVHPKLVRQEEERVNQAKKAKVLK